MLENFGNDFIREIFKLVPVSLFAQMNSQGGIIGYYLWLENKYEISIAFGPGTYSDYHGDFKCLLNPRSKNYSDSHQAEIAYFNPQHKMMTFASGDNVTGYLSPQEVLDYVLLINDLENINELEEEFNIPFGEIA